MNDTYKQLVQDAKRDYAQRPKTVNAKKHGEKVEVECPRWYDIGLPKGATEELNLWNYWQGIEIENPTLMLVGQDWGYIHKESPCIANIRKIANNPNADVQYLDGCEKSGFDFTTDKNLVDIFERHLCRNLRDKRYDDLYFTNLCLGYRQDGTNGYWRDTWLNEDADYFKRLVAIKQPKAIVCLGLTTSKAAFKALTGSSLAMPRGFYGYIDEQGDGLELDGYDGARFFAVPHPGGMGTANRTRSRSGSKPVKDDWAFLDAVFKKSANEWRKFQ